MSRCAFLLAIVLGCGLAPHGSDRSGQVTPGATPLDELMSTRDRAALAELAAARESARIEDGYKIGPEDLLDIRIPNLPGARFGGFPRAGATNSTLSEVPVFEQGYRVSIDGTVNLPLLGITRVAGRTAAELEQDLARALIAADLLKRPQVSVLVAEFRSRTAAMVGSVERPGLYPVTRSGMRLADLVWAAGGPRKDAGRVLEFRPVGSLPPSIPVAGTPPPARRVDDMVVGGVRVEHVGEGRRVTIPAVGTASALRAFVLDAPPRLVVDAAGMGARPSETVPLDDPVVQRVRLASREDGWRIVLDLARPIATHAERAGAGAIVVEIEATGAAAPAGACGSSCAAPQDPGVPAPPTDAGLIRVDLVALLEQTNQARLNPRILPGDVVSISPAGTVQVDGWVEKPGSYAITRGLTVSGAVAAAGGKQFAADAHNVTVKRSFGPGGERSFTVDMAAVSAGRVPDMPITDGDVVQVPVSVLRVVPFAIWEIGKEIIHVGGTVALF